MEYRIPVAIQCRWCGLELGKLSPARPHAGHFAKELQAHASVAHPEEWERHVRELEDR